VQCRLCEDVCIRKAVKVGCDVEAERILEFEPVTFKGSKKRKQGAFLGR